MIAGGLVGVAAVLSTSLLWTPEMAPVLLGLVTFGLALSMGAAMAPADRRGDERRARRPRPASARR